MMNRKYLLSMLCVGLMSSGFSAKANDHTALGTIIAGGVVLMGLGTIYHMREEIVDDFTAKYTRPSTSLSQDLAHAAGVCVAVPAVIALAAGTDEGCKSITNAVIGGAAYCIVNRLVEAHNFPFWPSALVIALYSAQAAACDQLQIPRIKF